MSKPTDGLHRNGKPLTDREFRNAADHCWINAFQTIRPSDEFAAEVGHMVIRKLREARNWDEGLTTAPVGDLKGSPAIVIWFNAS